MLEMFWAWTDFFKDALMRIRNRFNIWTIRDRGFLLKMTVVPVVDQRDDLRPHGPVMDDFLSVSTKRKTCSFPWFISSGNWKKMKELKVNFQQWDGGLSWQALQSAITPHSKCLFPRRPFTALEWWHFSNRWEFAAPISWFHSAERAVTHPSRTFLVLSFGGKSAVMMMEARRRRVCLSLNPADENKMIPVSSLHLFISM